MTCKGVLARRSELEGERDEYKFRADVSAKYIEKYQQELAESLKREKDLKEDNVKMAELVFTFMPDDFKVADQPAKKRSHHKKG